MNERTGTNTGKKRTFFHVPNNLWHRTAYGIAIATGLWNQALNLYIADAEIVVSTVSYANM